MASRNRNEPLPRNPQRPVPPLEKPPRGCTEITDERLDEYLNKATADELRILLIKGWNAGAFRLYVKSSEGAEEEGLEIDDVFPWPPGSGGSETPTTAAKKSRTRKAAKKTAGKLTRKAKKTGSKVAKRAASKKTTRKR